MARISIDDSLFKDERFFELTTKLGSMEAALGAVVKLWIVAQEFWKKDHGLISKQTWKKKRLKDELIAVGLAIETDAGIYAAGSKKNFAWLVQRVSAGKKSGSSRRSKNKDLQMNGTERDRTSVERERTVVEPSSSSSSSSKKENIRMVDDAKASPPRPPASPLFKMQSEEHFFETMPKDVLDRWDALYESDYVEREVSKILNWLSANPKKNHRTTKGWTQFVSSWLERGWNDHLKRIGTNSKKPKSIFVES